jgi:hypothetical protein
MARPAFLILLWTFQYGMAVWFFVMWRVLVGMFKVMAACLLLFLPGPGWIVLLAWWRTATTPSGRWGKAFRPWTI